VLSDSAQRDTPFSQQVLLLLNNQASSTSARQSGVLDIGSRRQLFLDDLKGNGETVRVE